MAHTVRMSYLKVFLDGPRAGEATVGGDVESRDGAIVTTGNFGPLPVALNPTTLADLAALKNTALATHGIP